METFQVNQNQITNEDVKRYKCHLCDPPNCSNPSICFDAIQCWKSRVRETSGLETVTRGCTKETDQLPFLCRTPSFSGQQKRQASGQFQVDCCTGDFCNEGDFPELPILYTKNMTIDSHSVDYALKMTAAVLGPMVVIGTLGESIHFLKFTKITQTTKD